MLCITMGIESNPLEHDNNYLLMKTSHTSKGTSLTTSHLTSPHFIHVIPEEFIRPWLLWPVHELEFP